MLPNKRSARSAVHRMNMNSHDQEYVATENKRKYLRARYGSRLGEGEMWKLRLGRLILMDVLLWVR